MNSIIQRLGRIARRGSRETLALRGALESHGGVFEEEGVAAVR